MLISTNAIVLKTIPYGDSSIISRIFTEEMGKVTIMAKGAWRKKNTTGALLEPMNHIHLQYYQKSTRDIQLMKDGGFTNQYPNLRKNLKRIILGLAMVETLDKATWDNNPFPVLYRLAWRVLEKLNDERQNIQLVFVFFLYQISLRIGFMPQLKYCNKCQLELTQGRFDEQLGELVCLECTPQGKLQLGKTSLAFLRQLEQIHLDDLKTITINNIAIFDSILFLEHFTQFHIESLRKIKSMKMVHNLILNPDFQ